MLGANSEEELAEEDPRWSLPDWNALWAPWLPEDRWCHWGQVLTDEAGRSSTCFPATTRRYRVRF